VPVGLWDGDTENTVVVRDLLADLVARGLAFEQGILCVLDGGSAHLNQAASLGSLHALQQTIEGRRPSQTDGQFHQSVHGPGHDDRCC